MRGKTNRLKKEMVTYTSLHVLISISSPYKKNKIKFTQFGYEKTPFKNNRLFY